ncbi:hypothetical protein CVT26_012202 [Gymnopilus dilepis]|uniref:F-box domain-containing protein n=1 Tax=Gymnopilus dilepis TaxID=231916 RepID=A0A409YC82_9AGAR|nr:hypothetical protein CVT26_012202 [Gymnopilus dilepis]
MDRRFSSFEIFVLRLSPSLIKHLMDHMDARSLIMLSKTSRTLGGAYVCYAAAVWNPLVMYKRWFRHGWSFRRLLRRCGAMLSGSVVFDFFDRAQRRNNTMHIFLRAAGADEVCGWLAGEGYETVLGDYDPNDPLWHGRHCTEAVRPRGEEDGPILAAYTFRKEGVSATGFRDLFSVKVIVIDIDPIQHLLFDFHASKQLAVKLQRRLLMRHSEAGEMNFLTADGAVSVFPYDTFVERVSYVSRNGVHDSEVPQSWLAKYSARGITIISGGVTGMRPSFKTGSRTVLDKFSWHISFKDKYFPAFLDSYYGKAVVDLPFEVLYLSGLRSDSLFDLKIAEPYIWRALLTDMEEEDVDMY